MTILDEVLGNLDAMDPDSALEASVGSDSMLPYLDQLHERVVKASAQLFRDGHYPEAVEAAIKSVFQFIRDRTGLTGDGAKLVDAAFSTGKPMLVFSDLSDETKRNEHVGFMELLKASYKGVRSVLSHTHGKQEEKRVAFEYMVFASLLCRRLEAAQNLKQAPAPADSSSGK